MTAKKTLLKINELKPGMISASNIIFNGKILLAKDITMTDATISKLKQNYIIDKVQVYIESDSDEILKIKVKTAKEIQDQFNKFSSNLENIFDDLSNLATPEIDYIRDFSKKIQDEFKSTGAIIRNIVFYGSGQDTIYRHSINVSSVAFMLGK